LREAAIAREAERASGAAEHPLVRKVLERFKGARIVDVRGPDPSPPPQPAIHADDEVGYADSNIVVDDN
jgi:DNA polymerase-3 subunit gamma/tau